MAETVTSGSCLCGSIQIRITGKPHRTALCHCNSCQKATSGVYAANNFYDASQVEYILSDPHVMKTYVDGSPNSGAVLERSFCTNCGSKVKTVNQGYLSIFVIGLGLLEDDLAEFAPTDEFFCANKASWLAPVEGATKSDFMPMIL